MRCVTVRHPDTEEIDGKGRVFVVFLAYSAQVSSKASPHAVATGPTPAEVIAQVAMVQVVDLHVPPPV
jgi:hypothetical protein